MYPLNSSLFITTLTAAHTLHSTSRPPLFYLYFSPAKSVMCVYVYFFFPFSFLWMCTLSLIEFACDPNDTAQHILHYIFKLHDKIPSQTHTHIAIHSFLLVHSLSTRHTHFFSATAAALIPTPLPYHACVHSIFFSSCVRPWLKHKSCSFSYILIRRWVVSCMLGLCAVFVYSWHTFAEINAQFSIASMSHCQCICIFVCVFVCTLYTILVWICLILKSNLDLFQNYQNALVQSSLCLQQRLFDSLHIHL